VEDGEPVFVDRDERSFIDSYSWSSDSRWLTYSKGMENYHHVIMIYDTEEKISRQVTSDFYHNSRPVFDTEGKYLFFRSERTFRPVYGNMDQTWIYPNSTNLYAVTLRDDVESPLAPRSDEEEVEDEDEDDDKEKDKDKNGEDDEDDEDDDENEDDDEDDGEEGDKDCDGTDDPNAVKEGCKDPNDVSKEKEEEEKIEIDFENFERRVVRLGVDSGNIGGLSTVKGKLLYMRYPPAGSRGGSTSLHYYDIKERKEEKIISDINGYSLSANGKKLIYRGGSTYGIIDVGKGKKVGDGKIAANNLKAWINPREEWQQMFVEAWRIERDYFYDPTMHGLDWEAIRARYEPLLQYVVDRSDLNYVIGEMIGELNCSHAYVGGGDMEQAGRISVGLLGCDFELDEVNNLYRIKKIYEGAVWDSSRSPLKEPGVEVEEGDYLLSVNGLELDTSEDPWASFQGLAGEVVSLMINSEPNIADANEILVKPMSSDSRLRNLSWIEDNRRKVEEATGGRVGYIYVPDTGRNGQNELVRQFGGQMTKKALIIDERFNGGGQIPDRFIELLNRPIYNYWALRDFKDWRTPSISHAGPKVMLINSWAGSGGDAFPHYFREAGLGPLIGTRTWGGLVGISHNPGLIDGGRVTAPRFAFWNTEGDWDVEGYGITPDYEVKNIPAKVETGKDEQLDKAVEVVLELLQERPPVQPDRPEYPDRSGVVK
jgi:tricorn protease